MYDNEIKLNVWNVTEQLLKSKTITIFGEVNTEMAYQVVSLLTVLSADDPNEVIKIMLCSPGGSVLDGLAIYDKIKEIPNPVVCYVTGLCASMGTIIASACDYVYGSEDASFMVHEISSGTQGKYRDMINQVKFDESLNKRLMNILAVRCKKTYEQVMADCVRDFWMTTQEALEYGLIDAVTPQPNKNKTALDNYIKRNEKSLNEINKTAKKSSK